MLPFALGFPWSRNPGLGPSRDLQYGLGVLMRPISQKQQLRLAKQ